MGGEVIGVPVFPGALVDSYVSQRHEVGQRRGNSGVRKTGAVRDIAAGSVRVIEQVGQRGPMRTTFEYVQRGRCRRQRLSVGRVDALGDQRDWRARSV